MTYFWLVPNTKQHEQRDVDWTWSWCARLGQRPSFADDYLKDTLLSCRNRISIRVKLAWLFLFQVSLPLSPICPHNPPSTQAGYVHQQQAFSSTAHWAQWSVQGTFLLTMSLKFAATLGTLCYPPVMCFCWNVFLIQSNVFILSTKQIPLPAYIANIHHLRILSNHDCHLIPAIQSPCQFDKFVGSRQSSNLEGSEAPVAMFSKMCLDCCCPHQITPWN